MGFLERLFGRQKEAVVLPTAGELAAERNQSEVPLDLLSQAVQEFKAKPHTPELITSTWQVVWQNWGERIGFNITVLALDRTQEELRELEKQGRGLAYVPEKLKSEGTRHVLGRIFPKMESDSVRVGSDYNVTNESRRSGWFDYEVRHKAPYLNTTDEQLKKEIASSGKEGMNLTEYIIASQFSKLTTGHYLDEKNWVLLLASRLGDGVVHARFSPVGFLNVGASLHRPHPRLGGRSSGVKKA